MFERLTIRGGRGALLWGYRTAAAIRSWTISKSKGHWTLVASLERADAFQCRQKPLIFSAPRQGGFWAWPLDGPAEISGTVLRAKLGHPEQ